MSRRALAVLVLALAVLASTSAVAYGTGTATAPTANATEPAEEAYVTETGDVILVYDDGTAASGSGYAGMNVSEGLVYGTYSQSGLDANVTGDFSMQLNRSALTGEGNLSVPRPALLENLRLRIESVRSPETARSDATMNATVALPGRTQMVAAVFQRLQTEGQYRTDANSLTTTGTANWTTMLPMTGERKLSYDLQAIDTGHRLTVEREGVVRGPAVERWNSKATVQQRLEQQFGDLTASVDGSSDVTLQRYDFTATDRGGRLSLAYTVRIEGLDRLVRDAIVTGFTRSTTGESTVDPATIRENLSELAIQRASVSYSTGPTGGEATWNVSIDGYHGLARAYLTALRARGGTLAANMSDRYAAQLEAMAEAEFSRTVSWQLDAQTTDEPAITIDGQLRGRTTNWQAYVEQRSDSELPPVGTQRLVLRVESTNETVDAEGSFRLEQSGMYNRTIERYRRSLRAMAERATDDSVESALTGLDAVEDAAFQKARLDATINGSTVALKGGAAFGNLSALTERANLTEQGSLERAYLELDEKSTAYVRLNDAVAGDASATDVRALSMVSEETTVHAADEWNASRRTFPSLNTSAVDGYLEVSHDETGGGISLVPIAAVGTIAVLVAIGLVVYWRQNP